MGALSALRASEEPLPPKKVKLYIWKLKTGLKRVDRSGPPWAEVPVALLRALETEPNRMQTGQAGDTHEEVWRLF